MLKRRLIPKLQMKRSRFGSRSAMVLVTTVGFSETIEVGDPVSQAKIYQAQAADELVFLDLNTTEQNFDALLGIVEKAAAELFMPLTVGGGVKSLEHFRLLLSHGADKICINTAAVEFPDLISAAANAFGCQCVVVSIDYRIMDDGTARVHTRGGKDIHAIDPVSWAMEAQSRGAGEILLTSIDLDGTCEGMDISVIRAVADRITIPVIAAGGCGRAEHFVDCFIDGKADAVSAGTYFCFRDQNPMQTRSHIFNAGVPIRIHT